MRPRRTPAATSLPSRGLSAIAAAAAALALLQATALVINLLPAPGFADIARGLAALRVG